jgi:hypothetical protein
MVRAHEHVRRALRRARTAEVDVAYHCRKCKVYDSKNTARDAVAQMTCRCGSNDLLLMSVSAEPSSPLRVRHRDGLSQA